MSESNQIIELAQRARKHARANHPASGARAIDEHVAAGGSLPIDEPQLLLEIEHQLSGFGALQPLLEDDSIEEIWINRPNEIFFFRAPRVERISVAFDHSQLRNVLQRMLRHSGRRLDRSSPYVDASLPDGSRLHVVIPDLTSEHWSVNIRKFSKQRKGLTDLLAAGSVRAPQAEKLRMLMSSGKNILVSGATQAGKTTLLCALLAELKDGQRLVSCEDTFEIFTPLLDWVALQTRPASAEGAAEIGLRQLVKEALRMRPDRLAIGEVRGAESLDMLIALNSGIPGICTIHANSAKNAMQKIKTLPLLAGENISSSFLEPTVDAVIDAVVHCHRDQYGNRSVSEIWMRDE